MCMRVSTNYYTFFFKFSYLLPVNVFFIIDEGKRYILNKVKFNGLESIKEKKLMSILGLKENSPYNPVQINTNLQLVDEEFQEIGKLNVSFDIKQDIVDSVNILINIDEGSDVYINKTWVSGMEKIDSSYICLLYTSPSPRD